jgi:hypothetical protein
MQNKKEKKKTFVDESSSAEEDSEEIEDESDDEDIQESSISIDEVEDESEKDVEAEVGESEADSGAEDDENGVEDAGDGEEESSEDEELKTLGNEDSKKAEITFSDKSFEEFGIGKWLRKQLNEYGLTRPTPVQANCIPKIFEASDVLGCVKTGTGTSNFFKACC